MNLIEALVNALRLPELRNKILFTGGILVLFRFFANVVDGNDAGVGKASGGLSFVDEAFAVLPFRVRRLPRQRDRFDRYFTVYLGVAGTVDHPHCAPPKFGQNLVAAEALAVPVFVHEFHWQAPTLRRHKNACVYSRVGERALPHLHCPMNWGGRTGYRRTQESNDAFRSTMRSRHSALPKKSFSPMSCCVCER